MLTDLFIGVLTIIASFLIGYAIINGVNNVYQIIKAFRQRYKKLS